MTNDGTWYVLHEINPEPWRVGPLSVGRNRRTEALFPVVGQDQQLRSFQDAVQEAVRLAAVPVEGFVELRFYFWRRLDSYKGARKAVTKNEVDATNMQKATEDALQGLVMPNDNLVRRIQTTVVDQGSEVEPRIVIYAAPWLELDIGEIPTEIWERINQTPTLLDKDDSNVWPPRPTPPVEVDCRCIGRSHYVSCPLWVMT